MTGLVEKKTSRGTRYYENEDGEIAAKECTKCEVIKTANRFSKSKNKLGGLNSHCKECERKYKQENKEIIIKYYQENKERIAEYQRKYKQENKESIAENARKYQQENKETIAEKARKYQQENKESIAENARKYYQENKERITEYQQENKERIAEHHRKYQQENKESIAEHHRKYRQENKERILKYYQENKKRIAEVTRKYKQENKESIAEKARKYQQENKELFQIKSARRRAQKRKLPDDLTSEQRTATLERFNSSCALTGYTEGIHLDHVIPIATGHGGTISQNMIPLRADLNHSKNARCIFDWFYDVKDYFKLSQTKFDELIEYLADINGMTADEYEDYVRGCHDNQR